MRIKVIIPNSGMDSATLKEREEMLRNYCRHQTDISVDCIEEGPVSIESAYDEALAGPQILKKAKEAESQGFDAVVVYCGSDPCVDALRELLSIPVIGPGKVTQLMALDLGHRFSVLTVLESCIPRDRETVFRRGIPMDRLASVRSIGIPVSGVRQDLERTYEALLCAAKKAVEEDGAHCLVLSCLGMAGMGTRLGKALGIPVLDPAPIGIQYAELLVSLNLTYSPLSFPMPAKKGI